MATPTNSTSSVSTHGSWALPIAASILITGSLMFWTSIGLVWLAARPARQQPIVIWMPAAAYSVTVDQENHFQHRPASTPQDR